MYYIVVMKGRPGSKDFIDKIEVYLRVSGRTFTIRDHTWRYLNHAVITVPDLDTVRKCNILAHSLDFALIEGTPTMFTDGETFLFDGCPRDNAYSLESGKRKGDPSKLRRSLTLDKVQELMGRKE